MTAKRCQPCIEDEHDCCHNRLWEAGCPCKHRRWPEPRCGILGKRSEDVRVYVCDAPRHGHRINLRGQLVHEGRYWYLPAPVNPDNGHPWWGWNPTPLTWTWKRAFPGPPVGFDPYDPDMPAPPDFAGVVE
jgi:hypothetical protein